MPTAKSSHKDLPLIGSESSVSDDKFTIKKASVNYCQSANISTKAGNLNKLHAFEAGTEKDNLPSPGK